MKYYRIKNHNRRNSWYVVHNASGNTVTPVGPLNSCKKLEALAWCGRCETAAPTKDASEAAQMLIAAGIPQGWRERSLSLVGLKGKHPARHVF